MGTEGLAHFGEVPHTARELGLKGVVARRRAVRVHAQSGLLHRLPTAVVQHHGEDGQARLLRHRINRRGRAEVKAAVAHDLNHAHTGLGQLGAQGHAAAVTQATARAGQERQRRVACDLGQHYRRVADGFVDHHIVRCQGRVDGGADEGRRQCVNAARIAGLHGSSGNAKGVLLSQCRHPRSRCFGQVRPLGQPLLYHCQHIRQGLCAIDRVALLCAKAPHGKVLLDCVGVQERPVGVRGGAHVLGQPGHIHIQEQAHIGTGQRRGHVKAGKTGRAARHAQVRR